MSYKDNQQGFNIHKIVIQGLICAFKSTISMT